jgi:hypothetical protein
MAFTYLRENDEINSTDVIKKKKKKKKFFSLAFKKIIYLK